MVLFFISLTGYKMVIISKFYIIARVNELERENESLFYNLVYFGVCIGVVV